MRQIPGAERVGREAAVDERERALEAGVAQVGVVGPELRRAQQALVHEPLRGQADDRELGLGHAGRRGRPLDPAADHVELALEGGLIAGAALDEELAHDRLGGPREPPDPVAVDRSGRASRAPAGPPRRRCGRTAPRSACATTGRGAGRRAPSRRPPGGGSSCPTASRNTARRNRCGSWVMIPAPSPVSGSAPVAPRWSRFSRARRARQTSSCAGRPSRLTSAARPQAACSNRGSYRPDAGGGGIARA